MSPAAAPARVHAALAAAVPEWPGPAARLVALSPPRPHAWSIQFDLTVESASRRRALVVKIPRWEEAPTLEAALAAGPQEGTRREYATLEALAAAVAASGDPGVAAVLPVAYVAEINAVVTERLAARPLRAHLGRFPGGEGRCTEVLRRAGRVLRLYHERVAGASSGSLDGLSLGEQLERMGARSPACGELLRERARQARERHGASAIVGATHGDCNLVNLLVTTDGRAALLDPNLVPGPLLADVAKFLVALRLRRERAVFVGRWGDGGLGAAEAAFLEGYGPADRDLLGFLCGVATVQRGVEMEERLRGLPGGVRGAGLALLRRYIAAEGDCR
ncbi:MAG: phosphotransferase [Acidimicrobiia bacterium]|nr:phosphotransferase [Acidimicrobiia bacterium]